MAGVRRCVLFLATCPETPEENQVCLTYWGSTTVHRSRRPAEQRSSLPLTFFCSEPHYSIGFKKLYYRNEQTGHLILKKSMSNMYFYNIIIDSLRSSGRGQSRQSYHRNGANELIGTPKDTSRSKKCEHNRSCPAFLSISVTIMLSVTI